MSIDIDKIGRRISEERKVIRNISQEKMAEDLGLYQADISNLEHARKGSGITDLLRLDTIASYFDISLESLLFGSGREANMVQYYGETMSIKRFSPKKKISKVHRGILARLTENSEDQIVKNAVSYSCGPYSIHILTEYQSEMGAGPDGTFQPIFTLPKLHLYVFFQDELVACTTVSCTKVFWFVYEPYFRILQTLIQPDVLDVFDTLRRLNPYYPLILFGDDPEENENLERHMYQRMDELRTLADDPILFIESVYVLEDCRRKGMCRLLLDVLRELFGSCTIWLNMEPTAGEELTDFTSYFPTYTQSEVGQLSMNASIAERLGFTIDPDSRHFQVETVEDDGSTGYQTVEHRKCAYQLSAALQKILEHDGDLVALGRAKQKLAQANESDHGVSGIADLKVKQIDDQKVAELRVADKGSVWYKFCVHRSDGSLYFAASRKSPLIYGLEVEVAETCTDPEEKPDSPHYNDWKLLSCFAV